MRLTQHNTSFCFPISKLSKPHRFRILPWLSSQLLILAAPLALPLTSYSAPPEWDIVGDWYINYEVEDGLGDLSFTVLSEDGQTGVFSGWDHNFNQAFSGTVSGSYINFTDYQYGHDSFGNPLLNVLSIEGSINADGTMGGPMDQNNGGTDWHGSFWTISGQAISNSGPIFALQPVSQVINAGDPVTFTALATGHPTVTYQWQFNGTNIADATNSSISVTSTGVTNLGYYDVVASNSIGTNISNTASLGFLNIQCVPSLVLYGPPGMIYRIERATAAGGLTNWTVITNITLGSIQPVVYMDPSSATNKDAIYVAVPQSQQ